MKNTAARPEQGWSATPSGLPRWGLDILIACTILLLLNALAIRSHAPSLFKANATESLLLMGTQRISLSEHFAVTGTWLDSDLDLQRDVAGESGSRSGPVRDADEAREQALSGRSQTPAKSDEGRRSESRSGFGKTAVEIIDGVIVAAGRGYSGYPGIALMTLQPAVLDGPEQPTMRWVCGSTPVPTGWRSPVATAPGNLPDAFTYSFCRGATPS